MIKVYWTEPDGSCKKGIVTGYYFDSNQRRSYAVIVPSEGRWLREIEVAELRFERWSE